MFLAGASAGERKPAVTAPSVSSPSVSGAYILGAYGFHTGSRAAAQAMVGAGYVRRRKNKWVDLLEIEVGGYEDAWGDIGPYVIGGIGRQVTKNLDIGLFGGLAYDGTKSGGRELEFIGGVQGRYTLSRRASVTVRVMPHRIDDEYGATALVGLNLFFAPMNI